ncbi:MAG: hypothetical protein NTV73_01845 [Hyphomicrobiales bacterium]|nr:hypothetical protein [Hyphomicrobiales bacterium]
MASSAAAQGTIATLRNRIAEIEGRFADKFDGAGAGDVQLNRHHGRPRADLLATGAARFDAALGGGLPGAGLTEIHAAATRDAAAAAAFVLALARPSLEATSAPFLWVGVKESFREAGYPYSPGIGFLFGIAPSRLLVAQADRLADALWIAEQAAALDGFAAILLETRGNSARLDLTATRRLHQRARDAGHPLFLLRQAALSEPTAAPFRLVVRSAPAGPRHVLGPSASHRPLARSIGAKNPLFVVPASRHGTPAAAAAGTLLAFPAQARQAAAGHQPAGEQHPADRRLG